MKDNKLIADFMGMKYSDERSFNDGEWTHSIKSLSKFETSWDWLMPVANEIIKSRDEQNADWDLTDLKYALQTTNIEYVYKAVVEFIKECNESNNENIHR